MSARTIYTQDDLTRAVLATRRAIDLRISNAHELVALRDDIGAELGAAYLTRTIVTGPERSGEGNWPWVVKVTAPGGETKTHRFGRREQAEQFASYTRALAAWDET